MLDPIVKQYPYKSYVYVCYINKIPVYVGKGTGKRYLHCMSGKSSNPQLNQALFTYGIDSFDVQIPHFNLSDRKAYQIERRLINSLIAQGYELFNSDYKTLSLPDPKEFFGHTDLDSIPEWVTEEIK